MAIMINAPTRIQSQGNKPKIIQEFIGCINSKTKTVSIAKMTSPEGWIEPGQTPEFDEYTIVLQGILCVQTRNESFEVKAGQAFIAEKGEWIQYSTPSQQTTEYVAVCIPAFSPDTVHRDEVAEN